LSAYSIAHPDPNPTTKPTKPNARNRRVGLVVPEECDAATSQAEGSAVIPSAHDFVSVILLNIPSAIRS